MYPFYCYPNKDSNNPNAARMSAAAEGLTEAILYFRKAKMQTNPVIRTNNNREAECLPVFI